MNHKDLDHSSVVRETFSDQLSVLSLKKALEKKDKYVLAIEGLTGSSKAVALSVSVTGGLHIIVLNNREEALYFAHDLCTLIDPDRVFFYPASAQKKLDKYSDSSAQVQRTATLQAICQLKAGAPPVFVATYPQAIGQKVADKKKLKSNSFSISVGDKISHAFLKEQLVISGFEKVDYVSEPGQFAVRGGIIDLFSYADNQACRIDFFGDEVEDIRIFECNTQRSLAKVSSIILVPNMQEEGSEGVSLLEFVEEDTLLWIDAPHWGNIPDHFSRCYFNPDLGAERPTGRIAFHIQPQPLFNKNFDLLAQEFLRRRAEGYRVCVLSESFSQIERFKQIFASIKQADNVFEPQLFSLHKGFIDTQSKLCVYTDHQIFDRFHRVKARRAVERSERITVQELSGFQIGDYMVHIDHGVGVFGGLVKTEINGKPQEVVKLIYKNNDVLFVNIHGLHRISKYKSKDATPPKIYQLGTGAWQKLKQQTKSKVKDIARELVLLYAQRRSAQGFAFSPDSYLQHELEASFIYEDTPDQLKATQAVKQDMEQPCPMDRLICGDVGFGKTEVAIRAALKAAADSKQVAVLVPTTILALQHYHTFQERLQRFPVHIDFICRLRSTQEVKAVLEKVKEGGVDILIGTHRLLNKDVIFKDLGLLVIDEEQKFGVAAKERLRQLKLQVDTLTLTATPIPRTLQFSLMGARDLSIIQTPPPNRIPVHTELQFFDEEIIKNAINYEMERGGQIFFIHNRVEDIYSIEEMVRRICPGVRTCVGHGQLESKELERVILDFMSGGYDLLVSTTIVENGLDIPNANTMIINHAQNFGLSDLHQLRGRVGRSNRRAFCYLLVPQGGTMTDEARRRLRAIEAFSDLGSGFNIAMQDLDIRGAGNLLGGEQSGFMAEMGFETYQRILSEAFLELNEEREAVHPYTVESPLTDCVIDTDLELMIPDDYVSQTAEKIRLYKDLDGITKEDQLEQFLADLKDRFGPIPREVMQLSYVVKLRRLAMSLGFEKVVLKNGMMIVYFIHNQLSAYYRTPLFARVLQSIQRQSAFKVKEQNNKLLVTVPQVDEVEKAYNLMLHIKPNGKE